MRNLIVCFDGTWNNPDQEDNGVPAATNVVKLFNAVASSGTQLKFYHPGLGGEEKGLKEKLLGGMIGAGITRHISSGYHWLASHYEAGDQIYIFGFSRGAFTARCLAGMLNQGLLDLTGVAHTAGWKRVDRAYKQGYRKGRSNVRDAAWAAHHDGDPAPVHFLGVWDTVGALGIPDDLEFLNLFDDPDAWRFHDNDLGGNVHCGRHAMAIDEVRSSFTVTRWGNAAAHGNCKEVWFPGVHSDVGGGYAETDLSDGALKWMMDEAAAQGLAFRDHLDAQIRPNAAGVLHNSFKGIFAKFRSRPRSVPLFAAGGPFHRSAFDRQQISPIAYPEYHPTRQLAVGDSVTFPIYADTRWNYTHLHVQDGEKYRFSAEGEWQDSKASCDWKGTQDGKLTTGDIVRGVSSFLGKLENLYKKATRNQSTDFLGTKRIEKFRWFTMVGAIANDGDTARSVANDGSPTAHEYINLPDYENTDFEVTKSGYFYAFPNDVWSLYENNHGSIDLTITRVA